MKILLASLCIGLFPLAANAVVPETTVKAEIKQVRDGDTVEVIAFPWPGFTPTTAIRLSGVDTPEMKGKCDKEIADAVRARRFVQRRLKEGSQVTLINVRYGKYAGRYVGEIVNEKGINVSDALIKAGHARPYNGGKRKGWCDEG